MPLVTLSPYPGALFNRLLYSYLTNKFILRRRIVRLDKRLGFVLLAIWLILWGLNGLIGLSFQGFSVILALLAIAAGVLVLIGR
jgi:hypothetical protein